MYAMIHNKWRMDLKKLQVIVEIKQGPLMTKKETWAQKRKGNMKNITLIVEKSKWPCLSGRSY